MEDLIYLGLFILVIYIIYWLIVHVIIPIAEMALAVFVFAAIIAAVMGLFYGLVISAYNYVEAINRVFGERVKNG